MERFENIKTSIGNAKNIKLLFPENPEADCLSGVLSLYFSLKKGGKKVFLPVERLPQGTISFLSREKKKMQISFNKEVSEVYYDKKPNKLNLNIVPKENDFDLADFLIEINSEKDVFTADQLESFDLVITINLSRFEKVDKLLQASEEELFDCTIINIDNKPNNENYGDINILENNVSISKIISIIIKKLGEDYFSKEAMSFLIYGFFSQKRLKKENISIIKWLIKNQGDFDFYYHQEKISKPKWINDFANILKNSIISDDKKIIYSYLETEEDNNDKLNNILNISKVFYEWISVSSFLIAFRDLKENITKIVFYSADSSLIKKAKSTCQGSFKENGGIILLQENPQNAIEKIRSIFEKDA